MAASTARRVIDRNPTDVDDPRFNVPSNIDVRAFTTEDVAALLEAAGTPDPRAPSSWPARDVAIVAVLAGAGLLRHHCAR